MRTMRPEQLGEQENAIRNREWDVKSLNEMRLQQKKFTTFKSGHVLYQKNYETNYK